MEIVFIYFAFDLLKLEHCRLVGRSWGLVKGVSEASLFMNLFLHLVLSVFERGTWFYMNIQGSLVISI